MQTPPMQTLLLAEPPGYRSLQTEPPRHTPSGCRPSQDVDPVGRPPRVKTLPCPKLPLWVVTMMSLLAAILKITTYHCQLILSPHSYDRDCNLRECRQLILCLRYFRMKHPEQRGQLRESNLLPFKNVAHHYEFILSSPFTRSTL